MARDTATDLVNVAKGKLEKIRKQKPKGEDPLEIAESRQEIKRAEQEQQDVIRKWQDVAAHIGRQINEESERKRQEAEAAKSEEQRQREAEEARIRKEKQDEIDRQRIREQIEKDKERRNKEYSPLVKAREEMAEDEDALALLSNVEPQGLEEWVSSLLRPHSMLWQDASESEIGLQSELGLKRADMQRMMSLLGTKESGAKPFGQVVLDIHEGLPEAMKDQYDTEDVRNTLLNLFNEGSSTRMMHLTEENRIEQARQTAKDNERRDREAEMEAWAEFYHLSPEEREQFEAYLEMPPTEIEEEVINQIIADNEQNRTSAGVDKQPVGGTDGSETERSNQKVLQTDQSEGESNIHEERSVAERKAEESEPPVSDNNVPGGAPGTIESSGYQLSSETDAEGNRFYEKDGSIDLWTLPELFARARRQAAPIRLTERNLQHILNEHHKEIGSEDDVLAFLDDIFSNAPVLRKARGRGMFVVVEQDNTDKAAIIKLMPSETGDYYNVETAGYYRKNKWKDYEDVIADLREPDQSDAVADVSKPQTPDENGKEPINAETQTSSSGSKGTNNIPNNQEKEQKNYKNERIELEAQPGGTGAGTEMDHVDTTDEDAGRNDEGKGSLQETQVDSRGNGEADHGKSGIHQATTGADAVNGLPDRGVSVPAEGEGVVKPIGKTSSPEEIAEEEAKVDTNPTEGQKEAGNYQMGHINIDGYDITIENPKGSIRSGVDSKGNTWSQEMHNTYGYIRGTEGVDGDHIDVFLSDNPTSGQVFVVDQVDPDTGEFDEHKVMYGFPDAASAQVAYFKNYSKGWKGFGTLTAISREDFKKWVESSHRKTKPFREYALAKSAAAKQKREQNSIQPDKPLQTLSDIRKFMQSIGYNGSLSNVMTTTSGKKFVKYQASGSVTPNIYLGETTPRDIWQQFYLYDNVMGVDIPSNIKDDLARKKEEANNVQSKLWEEDREQIKEILSEAGIPFVDVIDSERGSRIVFTDRKNDNGNYEDYMDVSDADQAREDIDYIREKAKKTVKQPKEHKRIVSNDQMEELRKKLLAKFNNLNEGIDPERMILGAMYAVGKIERGVTKFADYAREMIDEIGDAIRPYLKAFYESVRQMPEAEAYRDQMDSQEYVNAFDEYNFDKSKAPDPFTKAEQVETKRKARQQVKKIEKEVKQKILQGDLFAGDLFGEVAVAQQQTEQPKQKEEKKPKTAWWSDTNRPQSLDPKKYKTYMTDEAKEYFANFKSEDGKTDFTKWAHPNLAFITAAVWDGVEIPYKDLKDLPEIIEAEKTIKQAESNGELEISDEETEQLAQRLINQGKAKQERKALFIVGLPAGGKSSVFANPLAEQYNARIIDSDDVKPWLKGYDGGNGAGYVQEASAKVAEKAIDLAAQNGDNIIIPRIGGDSVYDLAAALRLAGYDVQLYFNDVKGVTSIDRAASRFAQTGRYLSLDYLTKKAGVPSEKFSNFAEKSIGEFLDERTEKQVQNIRGRLQGLRGEFHGSRSGLREPSATQRKGDGASERSVQGSLGSRELYDGGGDVQVLLSEPLFTYAEWKSNDVPFGEKPKEIWNSKSGKPMPGKKEETNNETKQKVSRKPESVGEGTGQASGSTERPGTERGTESDRAERSGSGYSVDNDVAVAQQQTQQPAKPKQELHKNKRNNQGERGKDYAPTSPKARFNANVEAIKMMRALMEDGVEAPTKDQMEVLRQYSGWGGLGTYFNDEKSAENRLLRDLLTDEEYNDSVMSVNSAYFTPAMVIDSMWDIAKQMGFKGGNVLEGSAGIGNIIGQMPRDMSRRSDIEAVEIDTISGNILKLLYPDAKVHIQGFQDTVIPNGSVDLAITNVPFVTGLHVFDKTDKDLSRRFTNIHDFCIAKNIRKLREGGIGIFISSSGTLDKSTDLRQWITDEGQADVVGAFRLNNETFGGTTATSNIIVVRKRTNGQKSDVAIDISKATPMRVGTYTDKFGDEHQTSMVVNDYFKEHPEMMAGEMAFGYEKGDTFRPGSYGLYPVEGMDQGKMLDDFVKSMGKAKEVAVPQQQAQQKKEPNQLTAEKEGRMLIDDKGRLCVSRYGAAVPLNLNDNKVKGQTKQQCFKDYQAVQKAVDDVLQQQLTNPDDAALKPKLDALNKAYDAFVRRYGIPYKNTAISFLKNDIDFPTFLALANYSETKDMNGKVTVTTRKTPLFTQRVLGFKTEPKPKTVKDALIASIFRSNGIDLEWIAAKLNEVAAPPNGENWTTEDVRKGILVSRLGFENPSTGQLEVRHQYLSGNVREKLAVAEAYNIDGRYKANIEELQKVVPMDIPAHLIDFTLGSSWIPNELYTDYLIENYGLPKSTKLTHVKGTWVLNADKWQSGRSETNKAKGVYSQKFRTNILGSDLVESALNNRPYKVAKQETIGYGKEKTTRTIVDQEATQACNARIDEIKDEFKQYIRKRLQDDTDLARRIEKIYNDKFNALVPMRIDDEMLPQRFEDSNKNISLYNHQKRGVMRGVTSPTMLAHEVGTGKSFTLITTAMEMRRLGTAKKPMIVVQNATVAQMTADAKLLYPNAKVLSLSEQDRDAEGRRAFYAKIRYNDWDMIIIPQSTLDRIPDSPERELQFIQEQIDEKKHLIEQAKAANMDKREIDKLERDLAKKEQEYGDKYLDSDPNNGADAPKRKKRDAKREAASLDKAETKAQEKLDRATDDVQFFDDLGVDAILVDEAHGYKHLGFETTLGRSVKGVDPSFSKKCAGLYNKTRSVFEKAGWKNVVFATGTPISNTAAEIWTFMKYLMPADVMKANDIYYFDDFVHNFGSINQMLEFKTNGKFNEVTRFAAYVNRPELMRIWMQVADIVRTEEVGEVKSKVPEKEGGKDQDVFLPQSPSLIHIMSAVRAELERFEKMDGKEKRENSSIPLTMYGIAKRAAIDPRLVDAEAPDEPMSKTNAAVKEIVKDLKDTAKYNGTVAVFCDNQNRLGAGGVVEFNIFDDMKAKLVAQGVPEKQIAVIRSSKIGRAHV